MTESSSTAVSHPYLRRPRRARPGLRRRDGDEHPAPQSHRRRTSAGRRSRGATTTSSSRGPTSSSRSTSRSSPWAATSWRRAPSRARRTGCASGGSRRRRATSTSRRRGWRARRATSTRRPTRPRFVAGSIGPTGMLPSSSDPALSNITFDALAETYYWQAKYLVEGGVDVLLVETAQDILEVKAALTGFERLFAELGRRVPVQTQVTLDTSGRMLLGTDIASALTTLAGDARGRDRPELLDGPGAHARAGALPDRARVVPDLGHPERGPAAQHRHGRGGLSARAAADGGDAARVRRGVRRAHRRRLLRHDARASRGDRRRGARGDAAAAARARARGARCRRRCARPRCARSRRRCSSASA